MIIDVSPETEAQLKAKAQAEGVSVAAYVERLLLDDESRSMRLRDFQQAIDERLSSLDNGEFVDGEEVMARLIAELDQPAEHPESR